MANFDDEDLRERVDDALEDDDQDLDADNNQDDVSVDDDLEEEDDAAGDDDQDEDDSDDDQSKPQKRAPAANAEDDDSEEDDDDPSLDYARPEFTAGSPAGNEEQFDVRTLPKDPVTGLIDPVEANKRINEFYAQRAQKANQASQQTEKTRNLLVTQWQRVSENPKTAHVFKDKGLREIAREMHLNSIGGDNYVTPMQAALKVARMVNKQQKAGYKSAKTRKSVERMVRTERSGGKAPDSGKLSDYEKAKRLANSRDPNKASEGRRRLLRIRREARRSAGV